MGDFLDDDPEIARRILFYVVLIGFISVGIFFVSGWLRPVGLAMKRKTDVQSHQYVEARKTELSTFVETYDELDVDIAKYEDLGKDKIVLGLKAQKKSLKKKIRATLIKIPVSDRPAGMERFLR